MGSKKFLIERYIWRTILPYFLLAWILLTVIILLQQSSRYNDLIFSAQIPSNLILDLFLALLPNILAFTSPMAVLAGIMIGFGQLQGDSELVAARAAGVSTRRILAPCFLLGILLIGFTLFINFEGVPASARAIRQIALKAALAKMDSPLEPGVFNSDIPKYVIYAGQGNIARGVWERVFIHARENERVTRLITARSGKIDSSQDQSELVLEDAEVTTLEEKKQITFERVAALRVALETGRKQLLEKLNKLERTPDEMGLTELALYSQSKTGKERIETEVLWHRRVTLAITPIVFVLLGVALSLRFQRGGRGGSGVWALACLVSYYLLSLFSEQAARAGSVPTYFAGWAPLLLALLLSIWWLWRMNRSSGRRLSQYFDLKIITGKFGNAKTKNRLKTEILSRNYFRLGLFGLLERDIFTQLGVYFVFATLGLLFLYFIFTTFELWRFAVAAPNGFEILAKYLFFISPIVFFQISPSALFLSVLAVYAIKSKRAEIVSWNTAGQNVYRLLLPAFVLGIAIGGSFWFLQENVLPQTNKRQDALKVQLRGGGSTVSQEGRYWFVANDKIYSFVAEKKPAPESEVSLKNVEVYEFSDDFSRLQLLRKAERAYWRNSEIQMTAYDVIIWKRSFVDLKTLPEPFTEKVSDAIDPFNQSNSKFAFYNLNEIKERLRNVEVASEARRLRVILQKQYANVLMPLVIILFSAPFALGYGKRGSGGAVRSLVTALGFWLFFLGVFTIFEQLGNSGFLSDVLAAWSPMVLLALLGTYFIAKTPN